MARGNWQRRVELNESRRIEAKQKKNRNEERKTYKSNVQGLISLLDQFTDAHLRHSAGRHHGTTIHVWTDTLPSDAPPVLDLWEEETARHHSKRGGRSRSVSIESEKAAARTTPTSSGKPKAHPRSKEAATNLEFDEEAANLPKLCRSYFFWGRCESNICKKGGGRKGQGGMCQYVHYPKKYSTLADVLQNPRTTESDSSIGRNVAVSCEASYPETYPGGESTSPLDAMDMLYYFPLDLKEFSGQRERSSNENDMVEKKSVGHWVVDAMASRACSTGSIVYFMIDNHLLYDRYQGGVILDEGTVIGPWILGSEVARCAEKSSTFHGKDAHLPAPVLEHILTFLEDPAVASMSMVCSSWNREIGKLSSNLWFFLLNRRSWPIPPLTEGNDANVNLPIYRDAFLSHYMAVRDMCAIKAGICKLLSSTSLTRKKSDTNDRKVCFRSFNSLQGAPQEHNPCVALKMWSPGRVLAAYQQDCTLRLFDSVDRNGSRGERLCREIVCLRIDPYRNTRKRACHLLSVALDDECIGCLLHTVKDGSEREAYILAVLGREDYLVDDDAGGDDNTQVIDIGEAVLNFLVSCDEVDHELLQLRDFLSDDGDMNDVDVFVSKSVAPCGFGRFMVEVKVEVSATLHIQKLFIFSSSVGAIVWMCDRNSSSMTLRPRYEDQTPASVNNHRNGRYGFDIVAFAPFLNFVHRIMCVSIDSAGTILSLTLLQGTARDENGEGNEHVRLQFDRPLVIVKDQVFAADNYVREDENGTIISYKSMLSCFSIYEGTTVPLDQKIELEGNLHVCQLTSFRTDHILAICRLHGTNPGTTEADELTANISCCVLVIDVRSRSEIQRLCIVDDLVTHLGPTLTSSGELPVQIAAYGDTVAAALWWRGMVLKGVDIRQDVSLKRDDQQEPSTIKTAKKKKKKPQKTGGKKDGFARGMSVRG